MHFLAARRLSQLVLTRPSLYCRACTDKSKASLAHARANAAAQKEQDRMAYRAAAAKAFGRGVVHAKLGDDE